MDRAFHDAGADAARPAEFPYRIERMEIEGRTEKWVILENATDEQVGVPFTFHNAAARECARLNLAA
jgi:hypothetical protein